MVAADTDLLAFKLGSLSMREAAALPLVTITAWEGLVDRAEVHSGQKVLIHAGAGGVGHIAVQLARAFGGEVPSWNPGPWARWSSISKLDAVSRPRLRLLSGDAGVRSSLLGISAKVNLQCAGSVLPVSTEFGER